MKKLKMYLSAVVMTTLMVACGNGNGNNESSDANTSENIAGEDGGGMWEDITGYYSYEKNGDISYKVEKGEIDEEGYQTYITTSYMRGEKLEERIDYDIYDDYKIRGEKYKKMGVDWIGKTKEQFGNNFDKWIQYELLVERGTFLIWTKKGGKIQIDRSFYRQHGLNIEDVDFKATTGVVLMDREFKWYNMYKVKDIEKIEDGKK